MDPIAAVAALSVMSTVVVAMYALFGSAITSGGSIRGRLEGLMSGTSVVDMGPGALKKEGDGKGPLSNLFSGGITEKLEIQTLTAQQKLTGLVIGALPLGVGVLFQFMSPEYIHPLFSTLVGKGMLGVALVLETVGLLIIQRILNIEV